MTGGADTRDGVVISLSGRRRLGHPDPVTHDDGVPPPAGDLSAYQRARQERASDALIEMFAAVLGKPLARRDLTPEEQGRREARQRERHKPA